VQDGLGSVRNSVDNSLTPGAGETYAPYGSPFSGGSTSPDATYGFTGEPTDGNALLYLRARYWSACLDEQ